MQNHAFKFNLKTASEHSFHPKVLYLKYHSIVHSTASILNLIWGRNFLICCLFGSETLRRSICFEWSVTKHLCYKVSYNIKILHQNKLIIWKKIKNCCSCDMTPCSLVPTFQRDLLPPLSFNPECCTFVPVYATSHLREDLHVQHCDNLKFYMDVHWLCASANK
jgi:hypothetical protein